MHGERTHTKCKLGIPFQYENNSFQPVFLNLTFRVISYQIFEISLRAHDYRKLREHLDSNSQIEVTAVFSKA